MDDYRTIDPRAVAALLPFLPQRIRFCEPCAGAGDLVDQLVAAGHVCASKRDIEPKRADIDRKDALTTLTGNIDFYITNPPWTRAILHELIDFLSMQRPTWLLFDADWMHNKHAAPYLPHCADIIAVGRLIWMPGTTMSGKDNCCWYLFDHRHTIGPHFYGRQI